ncbi:hypothetical protein N4T20_05345 [Flavobacterium sp. TR2]|uniref:hypothetical protein n=1 Tax=Flavobacterium sp. TR2 TaxID=2977321 RepID=UPI0021B0DC0F|nr:hypothetical protein [Flavobacterium sp. TR2]UWY29360.1 hypothetical protein N4T20_05345 [Flavobacterium sp. TR2]
MGNKSYNDFEDFNQEFYEFFENENNDDLYQKLILGDLNNEFYENKSDSELHKKIILQYISSEILELIDYNPRILLEFERVIQDERKYNIIDRFFYYSIEETRLINNIIKEKLEIEIELSIVQELHKAFRNLKNKLIGQIKYSFGLHSFSDYLESGRTVLFNNPFLLGISPFLFDQLEWETIILKEIKDSSHSKSNFYNIQLMIRNNLRETLFRLDKEEFENLHGWEKEKMSESELYHLIIDRVFNAVKRSKNPESIIKEIVKKNTVVNSSRIVLTGNFTTGKLIDKLIEGFGAKNIKLGTDEINDIKGFVSLNFKNAKGKNLEFQEIRNKTFFNLHKKLLKNILVTNRKSIRCEQKDISRIINKTLPELGELKTIENY